LRVGKVIAKKAVCSFCPPCIFCAEWWSQGRRGEGGKGVVARSGTFRGAALYL